MCGRYGYTNTDKEKIIKRFGLKKIKYDLVPRYNISPGQDVPVILNTAPDELWPVRWGLVPFWAKDEKIGHNLINARAETITEKPSFRVPIKKKRCLILADCFYEWKKEGTGKQPFCIRLKSREPFAFAGIWDSWGTGGNLLRTCSIITCAPNKEMAAVYQRMPVIIPKERETAWLEDLPAAEVQKILKPYQDNMLDVFKISTLVNSPVNDSSEILNPIK